MPERERRWNGWGFAGEALAVPVSARAWLAQRIGEGDALPAVAESAVVVPAPRPIPPLGAETRVEAAVLLRHAVGASFPDLIALRTGAIAAFPDAVASPDNAGQVVGVLRAAAEHDLRVVVRGGGTSVVGGVSVGRSARPTVVLSLERLAGLVSLDPLSRLAGLRAGTYGPAADALLAARGFRLGHEPQSYELSTVGGWIATRSAGQRSTGVGKIEDLVAGLEVASEGGLWRLAPLPSSAAGPDLRRLIIGSEGRLGVITEASVRVRPLPAREDGLVVLFPSLANGLDACRALLQRDVPVEVMRLSDPLESAFARTLLELPALPAAASRVLFSLKRFRNACALLLGWAGEEVAVKRARWAAEEVWRAHGGAAVGRSGWRRWRRDRFRHPYLRDALLDLGWGVDTFETAAPWSALRELDDRVRAAVDRAAGELGTRAVVLSHVSHGYPDGASLYFTFLWPLARGRELEVWTGLKAAATEALLDAGGTLSHHHGVGTMHAPWLPRELGGRGLELLAAAARTADPGGRLNQGVLFGAPETEEPR